MASNAGIYVVDASGNVKTAGSGGAGSGTVTNSGTLTSNQLIIGAGTTVVAALGTLGTTTTVLHGNAGGAPTFGAVSLTADVSGDLPFSSLVQASADSKLVGRGSASGAGDFQEISLGTGLSMSGTTLSATGSGGTVTTTGSPASGNLTKFSGAASITNGDLAGDVTTSGTLTATIANAAVTLAKIANAAANSKVLGSGSSGSGASYSELTVGTGLSIASTTLSVANNSLLRTIIFVIDGGGSVITTGVKGFVSSPWSGTLTKWRILSSDASATSGTITIDVWKDVFANYPPNSSDSICGSGTKPNLSSATSGESSTFTNYTTTTFTAGDVVGVNVTGTVTSVVKVTLELTITLT